MLDYMATKVKKSYVSVTKANSSIKGSDAPKPKPLATAATTADPAVAGVDNKVMSPPAPLPTADVPGMPLEGSAEDSMNLDDLPDSDDKFVTVNLADNNSSATLSIMHGVEGISPNIYSVVYIGAATSYDTKKAGTKTSILGLEPQGQLAIIKPGPTLPNSHPSIKLLISASKTNSIVRLRGFTVEKNHSKTNVSDSTLYYQINKDTVVEYLTEPCSLLRTYEHSNFGTVEDFEAAPDKATFNGIFRVIENPSLSDDSRTLYIRAALNDSHPTTIMVWSSTLSGKYGTTVHHLLSLEKIKADIPHVGGFFAAFAVKVNVYRDNPKNFFMDHSSFIVPVSFDKLPSSLLADNVAECLSTDISSRSIIGTFKVTSPASSPFLKACSACGSKAVKLESATTIFCAKCDGVYSFNLIPSIQGDLVSIPGGDGANTTPFTYKGVTIDGDLALAMYGKELTTMSPVQRRNSLRCDKYGSFLLSHGVNVDFYTEMAHDGSIKRPNFMID